MAENNTFRGGNPTWANACVGDNGNPSYVEYSKGFSQAANLLINLAISDEGKKLHVDDLVYPICFNMRHSIELRLKGAIEEIHTIARHKNINITFDLSASHDIGNIWKFFKTTSESLDYRFRSINSTIDPTIVDIASVDATGQTFRYPTNNESKKHLVDVSIINFFILKNKFSALEKELDALHTPTIILSEEYSHGTFTSKLNRPQLYKIAKNIPPISSWAQGTLGDVKKAICKNYGLSSNDFNKAIAKIREHHYLSSLIGEIRPLLGVSNDQVLEFFDYWSELHPPTDDDDDDDEANSLFDANYETMIKEITDRARIKSKAWEAMEPILAAKVVAGLRALYYFARDKDYVEYYPKLYRHELNILNNHPTDIKRSFNHIFEKTNALRNVLITLFAIGNTGLAEMLLKSYTVDPAFIESLKKRALFHFPDIAVYDTET